MAESATQAPKKGGCCGGGSKAPAGDQKGNSLKVNQDRQQERGAAAGGARGPGERTRRGRAGG